MKKLIASMLIGAAVPATAASAGGWAHVGNTYNSAIFVDRAIIGLRGSQRPFRTLHINTQPSAGWLRAEHRGVVDCAAQTLSYEGVTMTKTDGSRQFLPSSASKPVPFPPRGLMRNVALEMCSGDLGPPIRDPAAWTKENFQPG